jgi:hypothetical protein
MNSQMVSMVRMGMVGFLATTVMAQSPELSNRFEDSSAYIQTFADKLLSSLNGREQRALPVELPLIFATSHSKEDELTFIMARTQVFRDDCGIFWFVTDQRNIEGNRYPMVSVSSEDHFRRIDPGNQFKHWGKTIRTEGEEVFNALVEHLPAYYQAPIEPLTKWLSSVSGESLYCEVEYAVYGSLNVRSLELRLPSKDAFFLDASDHYVFCIGFSNQGYPDQIIFYPKQTLRPKLERHPLRPSPIDSSKIVSEAVRQKIWKAILEAKSALGLAPGRKLIKNKVSLRSQISQNVTTP